MLARSSRSSYFPRTTRKLFQEHRDEQASSFGHRVCFVLGALGVGSLLFVLLFCLRDTVIGPPPTPTESGSVLAAPPAAPCIQPRHSEPNDTRSTFGMINLSHLNYIPASHVLNIFALSYFHIHLRLPLVMNFNNGCVVLIILLISEQINPYFPAKMFQVIGLRNYGIAVDVRMRTLNRKLLPPEWPMGELPPSCQRLLTADSIDRRMLLQLMVWGGGRAVTCQ